jgi:hypothetical protein
MRQENQPGRVRRRERYHGAGAQAIDGAGLAHIAAHGVFRADSPLFSYLRLDDGPTPAPTSAGWSFIALGA